ncbi:MAG: RNA polymerase sigma factor [Candidatus Limnocylindria bacterium]
MEDRAADGSDIAESLTDPARFGLIFDRHYDAIHRYLARRVGWELAEDLTANVFLAAFQSRARFRPSGLDARPWLYGIATNILRRHARTEVRRLRAYGRLPDPVPVQTDADALASRLDAQGAATLIGHALARLPEADRSVLLLIAWADLTYEEVAVALDVPIGTVRSRLHRARSRLRELLSPIGQYADGERIQFLERSDG